MLCDVVCFYNRDVISFVNGDTVTLSSDQIGALLETAMRVYDRGEVRRSQLILQMLSLQHPQDARVWRAMAQTAATPEERTSAERQLSMLGRVTRQLDTSPPPNLPSDTDEIDAVMQPLLSPPAITQPAAFETHQPRAAGPTGGQRWLIPAALLLLALVLLGALVAPRLLAMIGPSLLPIGQNATTVAATGVAATGVPAGGPIASPNPTDAQAGAPTAAVGQSIDPVATTTPLPTVEPSPIPPPPPPPPAFALGQVVVKGEWVVTVVRTEDLQRLDGSIGGLQPNGRFALALVAVSNNGAASASIPPDLLTLVDSRGKRYAASAAASSAYLTTFGQGVHGDMSFADALPSKAGIFSVPLIFDVPADAAGLMLQVGDGPSGWAYP